MTLNDISPALLGAHKLDINANGVYKKINAVKTHASYRFMYILSGKTEIQINGKKFSISSGNVIYMPPYITYRFTKTNPFSLINVFFNATPAPENSNKLIYLGENKNLPAVKSLFDEEILNGYIIDKKPQLESAFIKLTKSLNGKNSSFIEKSTLLYIISYLITKDDDNKQPIVDNIVNYVKDNIESDLSSDVIASKFSYHKNYLSSLIKKKTGIPLNDFIKQAKIERAKLLILDGNFSLSEISKKLGFYDYSHFYKTFKNQTGISPTDFIK